MPSADYSTETWKFGKLMVEGAIDESSAPQLPEGVDINAAYYRTAFTILNVAGGARRNTAELLFHWGNSMTAFESQNVVPQDFLRFNTLLLHLMAKDSDVCRTGLQFFRYAVTRRAKLFTTKSTRVGFVQSFFNRVVVDYLARAVAIHEYDHPYVELQNDVLHLRKLLKTSSIQHQLREGVLNKKRFNADMKFVSVTLKRVGAAKTQPLVASAAPVSPPRRAWYKMWQAGEKTEAKSSEKANSDKQNETFVTHPDVAPRATSVPRDVTPPTYASASIQSKITPDRMNEIRSQDLSVRKLVDDRSVRRQLHSLEQLEVEEGIRAQLEVEANESSDEKDRLERFFDNLPSHSMDSSL